MTSTEPQADVPEGVDELLTPEVWYKRDPFTGNFVVAVPPSLDLNVLAALAARTPSTGEARVDAGRLRALLAKVRMPIIERQDSKGFCKLYDSAEDGLTGDFMAETYGDGDELFAAAVNALPVLLDLAERHAPREDAEVERVAVALANEWHNQMNGSDAPIDLRAFARAALATGEK